MAVVLPEVVVVVLEVHSNDGGVGSDVIDGGS